MLKLSSGRVCIRALIAPRLSVDEQLFQKVKDTLEVQLRGNLENFKPYGVLHSEKKVICKTSLKHPLPACRHPLPIHVSCTTEQRLRKLT